MADKALELAEKIDLMYSKWGYNDWESYPGEDVGIPEIADLLRPYLQTIDVEGAAKEVSAYANMLEQESMQGVRTTEQGRRERYATLVRSHIEPLEAENAKLKEALGTIKNSLEVGLKYGVGNKHIRASFELWLAIVAEALGETPKEK